MTRETVEAAAERGRTRDPTAGAGQPSLADLDGHPVVAWRELKSLSEVNGDHTYEVHASRIAAPPPPPIELKYYRAHNPQ